MLYKLSDRIYYSKHRYTILEPAIGYVLGDNYSVMIDAGNSRNQVNEFFEDLKRENLPLPSFVILTHYHWDHSFGCGYLDIPIISSSKTKDYLEEMSNWKWDITSIDERVAQNVDIEYSANILKKVYPNTEEIKIKIPTLPKYSDFNLKLGGITLSCYNNKNSHSDDALLIYVQEERVLFIGDSHTKSYYTKPMSFDKDNLKEYISLIRDIDFNYAIPGHGNKLSKEELIITLKNEYTKI